jgi:hypothetical protein
MGRFRCERVRFKMVAALAVRAALCKMNSEGLGLGIWQIKRVRVGNVVFR